jgi:hypothetical protein
MVTGRIVRVIEDLSRKETLSSEYGYRKFITSVFYPAEDEHTHSIKDSFYCDLFEPTVDEAVEMLKELGMDESILRSFKTGVHKDAPISRADRKYPVVIYSPGFGVDRDMFLFNIKKLVEEEYIVITAGHTYDTFFTVFPDGEIVKQTKEVDEIEDELDNRLMHKLVDIRAEDIICLLNEMEKINTIDEILKGKLDLNKIGMMGHSMGGHTLERVAGIDKRIKAGIILDGGIDLKLIKEQINREELIDIPLLLFRNNACTYKLIKENLIDVYKGHIDESFKNGINDIEKMASDFAEAQMLLDKLFRGHKYAFKLDKSKHNTFNDLPLLFKDSTLVHAGMDIEKAHEIISRATVAFLNEYLGGRNGEFKRFVEEKSMYEGLYMIGFNGEILSNSRSLP